jgi:hypothetical protein
MWYFLEKKDESDHVGIFALIFKDRVRIWEVWDFPPTAFFFLFTCGRWIMEVRCCLHHVSYTEKLKG